MGKTVPFIATLLVILSSLDEILTSQPSLAQYLQLAGLGSNGLPVASLPPSYGPPSGYPASAKPPSSYGTPSNYPPSYPSPQSYPAALKQPPSSPSSSVPVPLPTIANLADPAPLSNPSASKPPAIPKSLPNLPSPGLDSNVLNNLAIALQLLIVSNILNTPPSETILETFSKFESPKFESMPKYDSMPPLALSYPVQSSLPLHSSIPYLESPRPQTLYAYESHSLPNANFLGSSSFIEPPTFGSSMSSARPNPRSSITLMSPYDALGPNSPFSDPILSSAYSPSYSKKDFQSPYASILAADGHRDLFTVSDLF